MLRSADPTASRRSLTFAFTFFCLLALPSLAADDRFELKFGKDLPLAGGRVTIDHSFGELKVQAGRGNEVQVRATIRSSDEEIGKQIRIHTSQGADGVQIRTEIPSVRSFGGRTSYSVEMSVTVPAGAPVTAKNRFGSTEVRDLGPSVIETHHGAIQFHGGHGNQVLSTSFGSIEVASNRGNVKLATTNGSIDARHVEGSAEITNRFGSTSVADVRDSVTINTSNGGVEAVDVGGSLTVVNRFAGVEASSIGGNADLPASNGRVELSNVKGNASVKSSFGAVSLDGIGGHATVDGDNSKVEASSVGGNLRVDTGFGSVTVDGITGTADLTTTNGNIQAEGVGALVAESTFGTVHAERVRTSATVKGANGSVTLNDVGGAVRVRTTFGSVFLDGAGGAVDIGNSNGAISVAGLRGGTCNPVSLQTSFGAVRVSLPENGAWDVKARTSLGRVSSELPVTATSVTSESLTGTIGRGGCRLEIVNANGNIRIEKQR